MIGCLNLIKYNHPSGYNHKMSKLKNSICRSFVGILSVLLCSCGMMRHPVALDDVSGFKIDVEISDVERKTGYGLTILRLDGLLKDSALGITKTEIRQKHGRCPKQRTDTCHIFDRRQDKYRDVRQGQAGGVATTRLIYPIIQ